MSVGAAWITTIGIVALRDLVGGGLPEGETAYNGLKLRPPYPAELISTAVVYGPLSALESTGARRPAVALAWGLTLAVFVTTVTPKPGKPAFLLPITRFVTGGYGAKGGWDPSKTNAENLTGKGVPGLLGPAPSPNPGRNPQVFGDQLNIPRRAAGGTR